MASSEKVIDTRYYPSEDYHNFSHRGSDVAWRARFGIGNIYVNAAICKVCNYFIRSKNRHDSVSCSCGNVSVDGGSWYAKRSFKTDNFINVIEPFDDASYLKEDCDNNVGDKENV